MFQSIATTRPIYSNYHVLQPKKQSKNLVLIIETKQLCFFFTSYIHVWYVCKCAHRKAFHINPLCSLEGKYTNIRWCHPRTCCCSDICWSSSRLYSPHNRSLGIPDCIRMWRHQVCYYTCYFRMDAHHTHLYLNKWKWSYDNAFTDSSWLYSGLHLSHIGVYAEMRRSDDRRITANWQMK